MPLCPAKPAMNANAFKASHVGAPTIPARPAKKPKSVLQLSFCPTVNLALHHLATFSYAKKFSS